MTEEVPQDPTQTCKKCQGLIFEGHAYELGDDRWHIQCFNCFKCDKALGCNSNFLVLGNGSLVCSLCSYNCKQCGKKIDDLAILTGDKAYCLDCFQCRACKLKIEDLRYARTSKGLFCMSCHEDLLAKKKKHDLKRRQKEQPLLLLLLRPSGPDYTNTGPTAPTTSVEPVPPATSIVSCAGSGSDRLILASTPPPDSANVLSPAQETSPSRANSTYAKSASSQVPPKSVASCAPSLASTQSSANSVLLSPVQVLATPSLPTYSSTHNPTVALQETILVDSYVTFDSPVATNELQKEPNQELEANMRKARERLERRFRRLSTDPDGAILDLIESFSGPTTPILENGLQNSKTRNNPTKARASLSDAAVLDSLTLLVLLPAPSPPKNRAGSSDLMYPNKNIMIVSPNQFHDREFHTTALVSIQAAPLTDDAVKPRLSVSSPTAKANRQARVVETTDDVVTASSKDPDSMYLQSAVTTPKKAQGLAGSITSPPPLLALPQVPSTPGSHGSATASERSETFEARGLGLEGLDLMKPAHTVKNATPAVSNLEESIPNEDKLSRSKSTRRKLLLRHKRSVSGGLTTGSLSSRIGFFKSKDDTGRSHLRHVLESLIDGQALSTPPMPFLLPFRQSVYRELHSRSNGDTTFVTEAEIDFDIGSLKSELVQLDGRRQVLLADNMRLNSDRSRLKDNVTSLERKMSNEKGRLETLRAEIAELTAMRQQLKQENDVLKERNKQLEAQTRQETSNASTGLTQSLKPESSYRASQYYEINSEHLDNLTVLDAVSEDGGEAQKATRLKFWRRPKVSLTTAGVSSQNGSSNVTLTGNQSNSSSISSKMSLLFSSNSIHPQNASDESGGAFKSFNSLITKSRSTNLLDSFAGGANGSNNCDAPLYSSTIQRRSMYEGLKVPLIVSKCLEEVEKRGMDVEGIYRLSGGNSAIVAIENSFAALPAHADRKLLLKLNELLDGDINAVTSALKRYLRKLPDPLIPYALYGSYTKVGQTKGETNERCQELSSRVIQRLPGANKHALYLIGKHLDNVNYYSSVNRMNFRNLSVVFAPTIARDLTGEREILDMGARNDATELLFTNFATIFANYEQ